MPMPIERVAGASTRAGRLMIGPAGRAATRPSAIAAGNTASVRGNANINNAPAMAAATSMVCGRPLRSARTPPPGTANTEIHNTILMIEPAADIDQPRAASIDGPKEKIVANPTLNTPQINPAVMTAAIARRSGHAEAGAVLATTALSGDR